MLGQDLHHAAVEGEPLVRRLALGVPRAPGHREHVAEAVRRGLVGPEQAEARAVARDHVPQEAAEHAGRLARRDAGPLDPHGVVAEVGEREILQQHTAVRMRARTHPVLAHGGEVP